MVISLWTDDLPKCKETSAGQFISRNGVNVYTPEDNVCFYCELDKNCCMYGIFDRQNGNKTSPFIMLRMAAEIVLYGIKPDSTDEEIVKLFRTSFETVEKSYIENYDGMIAERTSLQYQLESKGQNNLSHDRILNRLKEIDCELSMGYSVVLVLVISDRIFVANTGDTRALLLRTDDNMVLRVVQLSVDHNMTNDYELSRLAKLGLDPEQLRTAGSIGNSVVTRCLGNFLIKSLHKAFPDLSNVQSPPVLSKPDISETIKLQPNTKFLVLVSAGVYKRLEEINNDNEKANKHLAQIIIENFRKESDFSKVSQAVLNEIEERFMKFCQEQNLIPKSNSHMALLIRKFDFPELSDSLSDSQDISDPSTVISDSSESNRDLFPQRPSFIASRRIKAYVDFSCYYENVEKARMNGTLPKNIDFD